MSKAAANLAARVVCDEAVQIRGGCGYNHAHTVERADRDIRGLCFVAGTVGAQRDLVGVSVPCGQGTASVGQREVGRG